MRLSIAWAGGAAMLAACSPAKQDEAPAAVAGEGGTVAGSLANGTPPVAGGGARAAGDPAAPPGAAASGTLRGSVSDLTGSVSGLNTRITDFGLVIDLPADALFEFDKAELTPLAEGELRKAAELIRKSPAGPIQVIGHTDAKGDDAYNQKLSEARARTVADWFGQQVGVRTRQFQVSGKGETAPIAPNAGPNGQDDPAGRAKNRRVEVVVPKPEGG